MLSQQEQMLWRRLSAFSGGFALEAAEVVCTGEAIEQAEVLDLLTQLADKSLVLAEEQSGEVRHRLLETIRQYGAEKLVDSGEEPMLRQRHRDWVLALAEQGKPETAGRGQARWLKRLDQEVDNIRVALEWCRERDADGGVRLASSLRRFWQTGHLTEGRQWLEGLLARTCDRTAARARALDTAGVLAMFEGDTRTAWQLLESSQDIAREVGDRQGVASPLSTLGFMAMLRGDLNLARRLLDESRTVFRAIEDKGGAAWTLNHLGNLARLEGDYGQARALMQESLAIFEEVRDAYGLSWTRDNLGGLFRLEGDYERARVSYEQSLTVLREIGDKPMAAYALQSLGNLTRLEGNSDQAKALLDESLVLLRESGSELHVSRCLAFAAMLAIRQGAYERGARLLSAAMAHELLKNWLDRDERADLEAGLAAACAELGEETYSRAQADGRALTMGQAIGYALEQGAGSGLPPR